MCGHISRGRGGCVIHYTTGRKPHGPRRGKAYHARVTMEGARQAQKLVRETSRAAYDTAVASPAEKVQQGIDRCEMEKFTDGFCRVLFTVLLVGAILAAWVYWLFWPIWWLAKGRFELTSGWTAAKCTIVQQRCYVTCKRPTTCLGSCTAREWRYRNTPLAPQAGPPDFPGNLEVRGAPSGNTLRLIRGNTR